MSPADTSPVSSRAQRPAAKKTGSGLTPEMIAAVQALGSSRRTPVPAPAAVKAAPAKKTAGRTPAKAPAATPAATPAKAPSGRRATVKPEPQKAPENTLTEPVSIDLEGASAASPSGRSGKDAPANTDTAPVVDLTVTTTHTTPQAAPPRRRSAAAEARAQKDIESGIEDLWRKYKTEGKRADRDHILLHYAGLVKYVAGRVGTGLPHTIEQDDLVQYGIFGLMDAIEKFEPERGLKFETYAISRIRGAIIDELRSVDWVPRSVRTKIRDVEKAMVALEAEYGRSPSEAEVAAHLNISVADLRTIFGQVSFTNIVALDDLLRRGGEGDDAAVTLADRLTDTRVSLPGEALEVEESNKALAAAVRGLPPRDRIVISLYYYEGLTLAEIGQVLGVTESRVCQLHTKATLVLRAHLSAFAEA